MTDLGFAADFIYSVNNSGQLYGTRNGGVVFSYSSGVLTDIGAFGFDGYPNLGQINNSGRIAYTDDVSGNSHAFLYSAGVRTDLGTLGGSWSRASGINNSGQIVGTSITADGQTHAFLYSGGVMTDIGPSGLTTPRINNNGQVVLTFAGSTQIDAWQYSGGSRTYLGAYNWAVSDVTGFNSSGQAIGHYMEGSGGFLLSGGVITDLEGGSGGSNFPLAINDLGQIVGQSSTGHPFLYDPVPLPPTVFLLGSGLLGLAGWRRFRKS
jgi:probable HAF family extracellular repeat protein